MASDIITFEGSPSAGPVARRWIAAARALAMAMRTEEILAPSMRLKTIMCPPSSAMAMFIAMPISRARCCAAASTAFAPSCVSFG